MKALLYICQQIWKSEQWPLDWKRSVFIPIPKKGKAKECSNYCTTAIISHAMLKILQARLHQYVNSQMFKVVLEKAEQPEIKLPTSAASSNKQESSRKNIYFSFIDYAKALNCVDHNKLENSERHGNTRPPDPWNNRLVPNRKKEYVKAVYCHLAYLTCMLSTS